MLEITLSSVPSVAHQVNVADQPNRLSRWWMRHYLHVGLASMAGSALLVCVIAVILLPIAVHKSMRDEGECVPVTDPWTEQSTTIARSSIFLNTTTHNNILSTSTQRATIDPLCAANATWKSQGVTVAGSSDGTTSLSLSNLQSPNDILMDIDGNLYIADSSNNRVVYWPIDATEGYIVAGTGVFGSWINLFKHPAAVLAWNNQLYVSDLGNYRILAFPLSTTEDSPDGITVVGRYGAGPALNQINSVYSMSVDRVRGLFYISDYGNNRILKLNLTDNTLQLVVGTGIADSTNVSLNLPLGITVDETTGSLYVTDSQNHRIQKFNINSNEGITMAGGINYGQNLSQLYLPSGVAIDSNGNMYIADSGNHRIIQWLVGVQQGRIIAGTGVNGTNDTQLNNPVQLKFDIHHNLYVVDKDNNRIQRFDLLSNGC